MQQTCKTIKRHLSTRNITADAFCGLNDINMAIQNASNQQAASSWAALTTSISYRCNFVEQHSHPPKPISVTSPTKRVNMLQRQKRVFQDRTCYQNSENEEYLKSLFNNLRLLSTALFSFSNRKSLPFCIFSKLRKSTDQFLIAAFAKLPALRRAVFKLRNCEFIPHHSNQERKPKGPLDQSFLKIHEQAS